jgi:8-hydroxy-5-deazaflavin:NADPH oxidoreductase
VDPSPLRTWSHSLALGLAPQPAEEAARAADLVVVTIPFIAHTQMPREALTGKAVLDTSNYYPERDGAFPELDSHEMTSSELLQRHLDRSHVVKAFNNIFFRHLAALPRKAGAPDRSALPIAGDDADAKLQVTALVDRLGYDTVDVGALAEGWRSQVGTPAYGPPYAEGNAKNWFELPAAPAPAAAVSAALAAANRSTTAPSFLPHE